MKISQEKVSTNDSTYLYSHLNKPGAKEDNNYYLHLKHHSGGSTMYQKSSGAGGTDYGKLNVNKVQKSYLSVGCLMQTTRDASHYDSPFFHPRQASVEATQYCQRADQ